MCIVLYVFKEQLYLLNSTVVCYYWYLKLRKWKWTLCICSFFLTSDLQMVLYG